MYSNFARLLTVVVAAGCEPGTAGEGVLSTARALDGAGAGYGGGDAPGYGPTDDAPLDDGPTEEAGYGPTEEAGYGPTEEAGYGPTDDGWWEAEKPKEPKAEELP